MSISTTVRKTAIAIGVSAALMSASGTTTANGLQSQLDSLFDGMTNTTNPGVWESQRRGVMSGGRFTTKSQIMTESLVSVTPPSWKAGCGGVDMFGGSFSFINAEQLVQLLRTVAANAKGYAFQLALSNVFPDGAQIIEQFQKKIQALNRSMLNSCETAQGVVNDTIDAYNANLEIRGKTDATAKGIAGDFFSSFSESSGTSTRQQIKDNAPDEHKARTGNIMWEQLKKNNSSSWFSYGDDTLLEAIMSLTGSVIVGELEDDTNDIITVPGNKIKIQDLIEGGEVTIYSCSSDPDECMMSNPSTAMQNVDLDGLREKISNVLLGEGSSLGVISKYALNEGSISSSERNFVSNLPGGAGSLVRNLSVLSPDSARLFVTEASGAIALAMVYNLAEDMMRAGRLALANSRHSFSPQALDQLSDSMSEMRQEYNVLIEQYGGLTDQIEKYNAIIQNVRKQRYMLSNLRGSNQRTD